MLSDQDLADLLDGIQPAPVPEPEPARAPSLLVPVTVELSAEHLKLAAGMALKACIGGESAVRGDDRMTKLSEDQIIGQCGQLALSLYWFGNALPYLAAREKANANPTVGDGGADILGTNLDVKTSKMRASEDPLAYRLLVRPRERHTGNIYILGLIPKLKKVGTLVHLVGWLEDRELPTDPSDLGTFSGAYVVPATELHPLPPLRWSL